MRIDEGFVEYSNEHEHRIANVLEPLLMQTFAAGAQWVLDEQDRLAALALKLGDAAEKACNDTPA